MEFKDAQEIAQLPIDELIEKILELGTKAEKYDKVLGAKATAPSGSIPVYEKKNKKSKYRRKPGQKKGHRGSGRKKPLKIDHYVEHRLESCIHCNSKLNNVIDSYARYEEDIPVVEVTVTEHTINGYWCSCCQKTVYAQMIDTLPNSRFSINLIIITAWLHYFIGVSISNILAILNEFHSLKITNGALTQAWCRAAEYLESEYEKIRENVKNSAVLHADETGWRISGVTYWLWNFATRENSYYVIDKSRGSPVIKEVIGIFYQGTLICDFWGAYNKVLTIAKQRCLYHLFTELVKVDKKSKDNNEWKMFRKKLSRLMRDAIRLWESKKDIQSDKYNHRKLLINNRLNCLIGWVSEDKDVKRLLKRLRRHEKEMLTFLDMEYVSPYNNFAEQQMRRPAINRKVSFQNRSIKGAKAHAIFLTLFQTAKLQKQNPIKMITEMLKNSNKSNYPDNQITITTYKTAA